MAERLLNIVEKILVMTARQQQLCCHREVGNIPARMLRSPADRGHH